MKSGKKEMSASSMAAYAAGIEALNAHDISYVESLDAIIAMATSVIAQAPVPPDRIASVSAMFCSNVFKSVAMALGNKKVRNQLGVDEKQFQQYFAEIEAEFMAHHGIKTN